MDIAQVSFGGVLIAAFIHGSLGRLIVGRLLYKEKWLRFAGRKTKKSKTTAFGAKSYAIALVSWLVSATSMAYLVDYTGAQRWREGLLVGLLCWLVLAAASASTYAFASIKPHLYAINMARFLLGLSAMGALIAEMNFILER